MVVRAPGEQRGKAPWRATYPVLKASFSLWVRAASACSVSTNCTIRVRQY